MARKPKAEIILYIRNGDWLLDNEPTNCSLCEKKIHDYWPGVEIDGDVICLPCSLDISTACVICGEVSHKKKMARSGDKWICRTHLHCVMCKCGVNGWDSTLVKDGLVCANCEKETLFQCHFCKRYEIKEQVMVANGATVCRECFDERYVICFSCGETVDRGSRLDLDGNPYCRPCFRKLRSFCQLCGSAFKRVKGSDPKVSTCFKCSTKRPFTMKPGQFFGHENKTMPLQIYGPGEDPKDEGLMLLGVELETNGIEGCNESGLAGIIYGVAADTGMEDKLFLKHDGSITGLEIVSQPATLLAHHELINWSKFLRGLKKRGITSYTGGKCGLHIHMNSSFLNEDECKKLLQLWRKGGNFYAVMHAFSRRGPKYNYCNPITKAKDYFPGDFAKLGRASLNFGANNGATIEFRLFRGTVAYERFMASIECVDAIAHWLKEVSWDVVNDDGDMAWKEFSSWAVRRKKYDTFNCYVRDHNLI